MKNLILILTLFILGACSSVPSTSFGGSKASLNDTQWILEDNHLLNSNEITLGIENGKISGKASCNNYFGTLVTDPSTGNFVVSNIGATRMNCNRISTEIHFLNTLEKANKYQLKQNYLELYKDQILLLKFKRK